MADTRVQPHSDFGKLEASLPFLPGNSFNIDHTLNNQRKSHAFDYKNGIAISKSPTRQIGGALTAGGEGDVQHTSADLVYSKLPQNQTANGNAMSKIPAWVAFDKKVLRFQAFEEEPVLGVENEKSMIRKFNIYFYLEDDSIHVSEPRTANSGTPQGTIIRRHRIPHQNAPGHFTVDDLNVGQTITLYARHFHIVSCDPFTREFLTKTLHKSVPQDTIAPEGEYEMHRKEILSRMKATRSYQPNLSLAKFLANDRQVLRFECVWDDSATPFGDIRYLTLHYFLADDTVEISEQVDNNSGRTPFRLKRSALPKGSGRYRDKDFSIGAIIDCYGRPFVILSCDDFTQKFYKEKYNITNMDPIQYRAEPEIEVPTYRTTAVDPFSIPAPHPPAFVTRSREDLSSVQLRFSAKLQTSIREDIDREFVLTYYPVDGTMYVFEKSKRNSGVIGGKYLERSRWRKADDEWYSGADLAVGQTIVLSGHPLTLTGADEYAINFMKAHPDAFPLMR